MRVDSTGHSWSSFWKGVCQWFEETFGAYIDVSKNIISSNEDYLFIGYETGLKKGNSIGNDDKNISIFFTIPEERYKILDYQIGYKIKIGNFSFSSSVGIAETNMSISFKESTFDLQLGINKIRFGTSNTSNGVTLYNQFYIRTIPTALALVAAILFPETIGFVGTRFFLALG